MNDHTDNCILVNGTQAVKMPDKTNNILKFNNFHKQQAVPFVIYADFEAITEKIHGCKRDDEKSYTDAYQNILIVDMDIRWYVDMMTISQNQLKFTEVRKLSIISWNRCLRRWDIASI